MLPSYIGLRETILGPFFSLSSLIGGLILDVSSFKVLTIISLLLMTAGELVFAVKLRVPEIE